MGLSVIHGRILAEYGEGEKVRKYILSIGEDEYYPSISTNMFSNILGKRISFYDQQIFGFAATYKNVAYGNSFKVFVLKFEKILREIPFDTAHIELETEMIGTYRFSWYKKSRVINEYNHKPNFQLIEMDQWYFGFGYRNDAGSLDVELEDNHIFTYENFKYPVKISEKTLSDFEKLKKGIGKQAIGEKFYVRKYIRNQWIKSEELFFYLSKLQIENKIDFDYEGAKGYSIIKLKEV